MKSKRRQLGQHLLVKSSVCSKMVDAAELLKTDTVLEIGTGQGALTREIASRGVREVVTFEVDKRMFYEARKKLAEFDNVKLMNGDAFDFLKRQDVDFRVLVSSLPYSRSLDFVRFLSRRGGSFRSAVVLVQDEFARKLLAPTGDPNYRAISVLAQISFRMQIIDRVDMSNFSPAPKVGSTMLKFLPKEGQQQPFFLKYRINLLSKIFSFRGRLLRNALRGVIAGKGDLVAGLHLDPEIMKKRVERLTPDEYESVLKEINYED